MLLTLRLSLINYRFACFSLPNQNKKIYSRFRYAIRIKKKDARDEMSKDAKMGFSKSLNCRLRFLTVFENKINFVKIC
jgi:hypothetical protein